jgi:hypothetical protein
MMMMPPPDPPFSDKILGTWDSATCETAGTLMGVSVYLKRDYQFTAPAMYQIIADLFIDPNCALKFLTLDAKGTYSTGATTTMPQGGTELNFAVAQRGLTAWATMSRDLLNTIGCGGVMTWAVGVRGDISVAGCQPVAPSVSSCPMEYDVGQLIGPGQLELGARGSAASAVCTARPTMLGAELDKQ